MSDKTSPCTDPAAEDLGDGIIELDGIVYEVSADACVPRSDEPGSSADGEDEALALDLAGDTTTTVAEPEPEIRPIPEEMLADGTVPEGVNYVAVDEAQHQGDEVVAADEPPAEPPTTTRAPKPPPTTTKAPEPEPTTTTQAPEPSSTTTQAPEPSSTTTQAPEPSSTTTQAPEPEPEPGGAPIDLEVHCDLVGGTWDAAATPQCQDPTRIIEPLPEPVGEPVTAVADEDDSFVSGSGRRIVRSEPLALQVGTVTGLNDDGTPAVIVIDIEELALPGWWQITVCAIHPSFVLADVGNVGWEFVGYAWRTDDGTFRVEMDNWGPGNDGPC
ncbi:MAG: hypothetical protein OXC00_06495 [Acidimicrobiaceae bacterium]|nr:hypothetical protein [Acidimicrobiaceae bacterium]